MAELVIVNVTSTPVVIGLPSGKPLLVLPGYGIQGDYFARYLQTGNFRPLVALPTNFKVMGISQPLQAEGVVAKGGADQYIQNNKRAPIPKPSSSVVVERLRKDGVEPTMEEAAKVLGVTVPSENTYNGLTKDQWVDRIRAISDTTLAQQMKLDEMKSLAKFLGIEASDILNVKADLISAIRVKTRG